MLRTIALIDDEKPARNLLREYLADLPDWRIIGEAVNGVDGVKLIQQQQPEIIFLDVQMPGMTGLELLTQLDELPLVVFSTAYDQYALQAFDFHAVDYLLKPYTKQRFATCVERLKARLNSPQEAIASLTQQLRDDAAPYPDRIMVPRGNRYLALPVADIQLIRADGDYSRVITAQDSYLSQYNLGSLEQRLAPDRFIRVHRSSIVHIACVREAYREGHGYDLIMKNGEIVRVSRTYAETVRNLMF